MPKQQNDIQLEGNNLAVVNGDFAFSESTLQHQRQLILNEKGDFKQNPTICVGAFSYMDDEGPGGLIRAISAEFVKDGMQVDKVQITGGVIDTNAFYKQ